MAGQGVAHAQMPTKQPVIDSAPGKVHFRARPDVTGHLEGGTAGDEVALQRKRAEEWNTIASGTVDEQTQISFHLPEVRRTAAYRLIYVDPATNVQTESGERVIRVAPRLTLNVSPNNVMRGREVTVWGRLYPVVPSRSVAIQHRVEGSWRSLGTAYVRDGQFGLRIETRRLGYRRIRAVFRGDETNTPKRRRAGMRVFSRALATWYGPGFYGNRTACGQRLTTETLGVAHRWLPCGTSVAVLYDGRTIMVPVIDRGPYSSADWDLTQETAERLGFSGTDDIGVDPSR
jgi:rare lipoprotein A